MNTRNSRLRSSAALVACVALLPLFAACNKQERVEAQDKAKDAYNTTADKAKDMNELKDADADYKQKLAALGSATAATWDSAKASVIASWDKLEASYRKALAEK
jgi:hypothetical protein